MSKPMHLLLFILLLLLTGCNSLQPQLPTLAPTASPRPSHTPTPEPTPSLAPTQTAAPQPTRAPLPIFGEEQTCHEGGFAFTPPLGYQVQVEANRAALMGNAGDFFVFLEGFETDAPSGEVSAALEERLWAFAIESGLKFDMGEVQPFTLDGQEGVSAALSGNLSGSPFYGLALAAPSGKGWALFGLVFQVEKGEDAWEQEGFPAAQAILQTVRFVEPQALQPGSCPVSGDRTYGFTPENPVRVGGDAFSGPQREKAYLNNLRGPNGETLSYERLGSQPVGETILDVYEVRGLTAPLTLYLDEYSFEELKAPFGLTCAYAFPLSAP